MIFKHVINYNLRKGYQLIILLVIAFVLNINTVLNQYAVDDEIVITKNRAKATISFNVEVR